VKRGRLVFRGRISKAPFTAWCATRDGRDAIARAVSRLRLAVFAPSWRARRGLWRQLDAASRSDACTTALAAEAERYLQVLAEISYADALPRAHVAMRRLILVPRAMAMGRAQSGVRERFGRVPAVAALDPAARDFLLRQIVTELDASLSGARPSSRRPVEGRDGWACVGVRLGPVWMDALWAGPDGTGHVFMYELPPSGLSRRDRKALDEAMDRINNAVASLSRTARDAMIRAATLRRA
jgi:hypothetical protein